MAISGRFYGREICPAESLMESSKQGNAISENASPKVLAPNEADPA
jgi:hypothetical protein